MTRWYRAYAGTCRDDKIAECAAIAACSRSIVIATWHAVLESAAETADGGRFETSARRVAAILGEPLTIIDAVFAAMAEVRLIDGDIVPAWKHRQFESDSSTERSRKHREAKRNGDATLQQRCATPPYTETEAETERDCAALSAREPARPAIDPAIPEAELEIRKEIAEAYEAVGKLPPSMYEVGLWKARGYSDDLIRNVVVLSVGPGRKVPSSLAYYTQRLAEEHARMQAELARPPPIVPLDDRVTILPPRRAHDRPHNPMRDALDRLDTIAAGIDSRARVPNQGH